MYLSCYKVISFFALGVDRSCDCVWNVIRSPTSLAKEQRKCPSLMLDAQQLRSVTGLTCSGQECLIVTKALWQGEPRSLRKLLANFGQHHIDQFQYGHGARPQSGPGDAEMSPTHLIQTL